MLPTTILRLPQVIQMTGMSRSLVYQCSKDGKFPKPIKLSERASGWILSEVEEWIASRMAASRKYTHPKQGEGHAPAI